MINNYVPSFLLDLVSDKNGPDFYVSGITFEQWWENASNSHSFWLFLGIVIGFVLRKTLSLFWRYVNKKASEEEKRENDPNNNENKTE